MRKAVVAGILYFAVVFAFAFAIGTVRVLLVASLCWLVWLQDRVFDRCKRCLQSRCSSTTAAPS